MKYFYDPHTGIFTKKKNGNPVGSISTQGYVIVDKQLAHRLAWYYHYGHMPSSNEAVIHLNGKKTDNRIENLELVSRYSIGMHRPLTKGITHNSVTDKYEVRAETRWKEKWELIGECDTQVAAEELMDNYKLRTHGTTWLSTQEGLQARCHYDPETGLLTWRDTGEAVATLCPSGYLTINQYRVHRLVWLYVYGYTPDEPVVHINGDKTDNRIINLRRRYSDRLAPGISYDHESDKIIVRPGEEIIGRFDTLEEANDFLSFSKSLAK